jgi:hypothetical protein
MRGVRDALLCARFTSALDAVRDALTEILRGGHYELREDAIAFYVNRMFPLLAASARLLPTETLLFIRPEVVEAAAIELMRDHWRQNAPWIGQHEGDHEWPETISRMLARRLGARLSARALCPPGDTGRGIAWMVPIVGRLGLDPGDVYGAHALLVF